MKDVTPSGITWRNDGTGLGDDAHGNVLHDCVHRVQGAKKDKNAPRKPVIMKDSASSTSIAKIQYGFSEGTIWGLVDGAKSVILDGTPLEAIDGTKNFKNVTYDIRLGTNDQTYMKGFPDVSNEVGIGVELKDSAPYVRAINDIQLSAIRVRLRWNGLSSTNSENGDISGHRIDYTIDLQTDDGVYAEVLNTTISDKVSTGYERTHRIELPRATKGWQIRIRRLTANSTSEYIRDTMYVDAIAEVIDAKFNYPNTAHMGIEFDSEIFRGIPKLEAHVRGLIIRVPTNYDPVTRTYVGMWDGLFKEAYTNNPAWIYYDIITAKRYGLGDRISPNMVDKWTVYALGVYCDQLVPDGLGGQEPRFTCNVYLQKTSDAYEVLSSLSGVFRAMAFWNGERIVLDADMPKDPVYTFSRANVIADENGICFNHTGSRFRDRHTVVKVAWDNPSNAFQTEYEYVRDEKAISKYGIRVLDLSAFACTSQGQAQRAGLWALQTEQLETRQITFSVGLDGFLPQVADVVNVADELFAGRANSGRVSAISAGQFVVTLDRDITVNAGDVLIINGSDGKAERRVVKSAAGRKVTMMAAFTKAEQQNIWALETADLKLMRFRIMSIQENSDSSFNITALQHEPKKFSAIDYGADVIPDNITSITPDVIEAPSKVTITTRHRVVQGQTITTLVIDWSQVKEAVGYDVEWRKDDGNWIRVPRTGNTSVEIEGVYAGRYTAQVRSISAYDVASPSAFSTITEVKGKVGLPPTIVGLTATGILFGFDLNWSFGAGSGDAAFTEIQVATAPNINVKQLGLYAYNTNKLQINGLMGNLSQSFRARLVDKLGFTSAWSAWVTGTTSASAAPIMDMIQGQINESSLNQALTSKIGKIETNSSSIGGINTGLDKAKADIVEANKIIAANKLEATNAVSAANAEIAASKTELNTAKTQLATAITNINAADTKIADSKLLIDANKAKLVLTDAEVAEAKTKVTSLEADYNGNKTSVSNALTVLTNKDKSLASDISILTASYGASEAKLVQDLKVLADKDVALTSLVTTLSSSYEDNKATVSSSLTTLTNKDTALTSDISKLNTKTDNTNAEIVTVKNLVSDNTGSIANTKTELTTAYKKAIDDIEIGGRNLLTTSIFPSTLILAKSVWATDGTFSVGQPDAFGGSNAVLIKAKSSNSYFYQSKNVYPIAGEYTLSFWAKGNKAGLINVSMVNQSKEQYLEVTDVWKFYSITKTVTKIDNFYQVVFMGWSSWLDLSLEVSLSHIKVEKGNKATAWTAAPEDVEADYNAKITTESTARADADKTITSSVTTLKSDYDANKASVTQSLGTLTTKDIALTNSITALDTDYQGNKTAIRNELTAVSTKTDSTANSLTSLTTEVGKNKTAITTEATTRSTEDTALSNRITTVSGKTDNALSRITTAETTIASNTGAITQQKTDITAAYKKAIDDIEIGGRNLLENSNRSIGGLTASTGGYEFKQWVNMQHALEKMKVGEEFTISFDLQMVKGDYLHCYCSNTNGKLLFSPTHTLTNVGTEKQRISFTTKVVVGSSPTGVSAMDFFSQYGTGDLFEISNLKFERGNKATDYTLAPEDTDAAIAVNMAAITTEATTRSTEDTALSNRITTVSGKTDNALSRITTAETTIASNTGAITQQKTDITAAYKKAIDDIEIGGRNLVLDTASMRTELGIDSANITNSDGILTLVSNGSELWKGSPAIEVKAGVSYTVSIRAKADNLDIGLSMPLYYDNFWHSPYKTYAKDTSGKWITISETFVPFMDSIMRIAIHNHRNTTGIAYYKQVKIEKGSKATDWTAAPEDVEADYISKVTAEATARSNADGALGNRITNTEAVANNAQSRVGTVETAVATNAGAIATTRTDVVAILDKDIAGKNLVKQGTFPTQAVVDSSDWTINAVIKEAGHGDPLGGNTAIKLGVGNPNSYILKQVPVFETTGIHTLSFWIKGNKVGRLNVSMGAQGISQYIPITTAWVKHTITNNITNINSLYRLVFGGWESWTDTSLQIFLSHVKIEKGSTATDWTAAPLDASAAIQIEATATANKITGLEAQYTVKLDVGGRVSGFGLASSTTQSDFAINADRFYIAPPSGSAKGTSPFMVLTSPQVINNTTVPAGTYMRSAYIHDGSINTAKIDNLAVTSGKIANLAVDTLHIADYAVSLPVYVDNPNKQYFGFATTPVADWKTIATATFPSVGASATITLGIDSIRAQAGPYPNSAPYYSLYVGIFRNGVEIKRHKIKHHRSDVTGGYVSDNDLLYFPTIMDTQKTTSAVVYEAKILGENFHIRGGGSWGSFTAFIDVGPLSFTVMAMKK